jgi:glucose-1-phosphate cytidylyltransferase
MNVMILAGGLGTRLSEETTLKPKPMVEIGGFPILWHIMKHHAHHGFKEFYLALGYKGESVKRYFLDYHRLNRDLTIDLSNGAVTTRGDECDDWLVHMLDTGLETQTGGRMRRLRPYLKSGTFMATYGDGVSDVDPRALLDFHRRHGLLATVTAVRPPARFGGLDLDGERVIRFTEKPQIGEGWINGGYMVFEPAVFDYIEGDQTVLERDVLERLAAEGQLAAFRHEAFWQCMDTIRDKMLLERLWQQSQAPWKVWS